MAGDSKNFIIFLLDCLHNELKKPDKNIMNMKMDQNNRLNSLQYTINELNRDGNSIISNLFFGFNEKKYTCLKCFNFCSLNPKKRFDGRAHV